MGGFRVLGVKGCGFASKFLKTVGVLSWGPSVLQPLHFVRLWLVSTVTISYVLPRFLFWVNKKWCVGFEFGARKNVAHGAQSGPEIAREHAGF